MKFCIPSQDLPSLDGCLCPHFGRASYFVMADSVSGESTVVPNDGCSPDHGCRAPLQLLASMEIDAVICRSMGRQSLALFEAEGIGVFVSQQPRIWQALAEVWAGEIKRLVPENACAGRHGPSPEMGGGS